MDLRWSKIKNYDDNSTTKHTIECLFFRFEMSIFGTLNILCKISKRAATIQNLQHKKKCKQLDFYIYFSLPRANNSGKVSLLENKKQPANHKIVLEFWKILHIHKMKLRI